MLSVILGLGGLFAYSRLFPLKCGGFFGCRMVGRSRLTVEISGRSARAGSRATGPGLGGGVGEERSGTRVELGVGAELPAGGRGGARVPPAS